MPTDLPALIGPAFLSPRLRELAEAAGDYARNDKAANTRRNYDSDVRSFEAWAAAEGVPGLPASGDTLALYLTAQAPSASVATLAHRLAAIRAAHKAEGWPAPDSPMLHRVWGGIRRAHGKPRLTKAPLLLDDLRRVLAAIPDTLTGKRDRALILVGFAGALRRSELAALELEGGEGPLILAFVPEGLEVRIGRAKADQDGIGAVVAIPIGRDPTTCATAAVRVWLEAAGIKSGPVFRRMRRWGAVGSSGITPPVVALVVKAAVERVGLDPAAFAGHSLRAGLATAAAVNDAAPDVLMNHMRHASYGTTLGYIRDAQKFTRNAADIAGL